MRWRTSRKVAIKFVDRYGREVHEFLAKQGYAPRLWYSDPLSLQLGQVPPPCLPGLSLGPLQMIVMDYIIGAPNGLPQAARPQIEKILKKLHRNEYIFGDLRLFNIIFNPAHRF
ncbi:hypothetical protein BYT27DRAFT_6793232 [Phlegmacium glaucopus]|nr:hypothetical protein BYT27DRAFT_6793232 [Phlegmacium glaucopus]